MKFIKNYFFEIFFFILLIILVPSYVPTLKEILSEGGSADFQWYPAKCAFQGINHYESYLAADGKCKIFLSQIGEYAQGFYIFIFPFTFFEWGLAKVLWFVFNAILLILTCYLLCKKFELDKISTLLIIFFIFFCISARIHFIMGQQAIFVLFFLTLPFVYKSKFSTILSGISYFKYNIGYALFLLYLITKNYKNLFLSVLPCVFGWIIYCLITNSNLLLNIFQPLELLRLNLSSGGNLNKVYLFSFFKYINFFSEFTKYFLIIIFTVLFNFYFIKKISKVSNDLLKLSFLCLLILISTPHFTHDNIILIPLLIYTIKYYKYNLFLFRINLFVCVYFLHFYKGLQSYFQNLNILALMFPYIDIFLIILVLFLNLNFSFKKKFN
jgi:hypothetical protein